MLHYIFLMNRRNQASALYGANKIKCDGKCTFEINFDSDPISISVNENIHIVFE